MSNVPKENFKLKPDLNYLEETKRQLPDKGVSREPRRINEVINGIMDRLATLNFKSPFRWMDATNPVPEISIFIQNIREKKNEVDRDFVVRRISDLGDNRTALIYLGRVGKTNTNQLEFIYIVSLADGDPKDLQDVTSGANALVTNTIVDHLTNTDSLVATQNLLLSSAINNLYAQFERNHENRYFATLLDDFSIADNSSNLIRLKTRIVMIQSNNSEKSKNNGKSSDSKLDNDTTKKENKGLTLGKVFRRSLYLITSMVVVFEMPNLVFDKMYSLGFSIKPWMINIWDFTLWGVGGISSITARTSEVDSNLYSPILLASTIVLACTLFAGSRSIKKNIK